MGKTYKFEHNIGDIVYLRTDINQYQRIITGITIRTAGVLYSVGCGMDESFHYAFELTTEANVLMRNLN